MSIRLISFVFASTLLACGGARAQDYSAGKTPAQLFASDCATCHKSPQGLAKSSDTRSLTNFLREHYTTKQETAGALAAFVAGQGGGAAPAEGRARGRTAAPAEAAGETGKPATRRAPAADEGGKPASRSAVRPAETPKPESAKPESAKSDAKPDASGEAKPADPASSAETPRRGTRTRTVRPSEAAPEAQPSTPAIIRHESGSRPATRPVPAKREAARPVESAPAAPAREDDKLKSYLSSGEPAKAGADSAKPSASGDKLHSYATSGGSVDAAAGAKSADKPATDKPAAAEPPAKPAE